MPDPNAEDRIPSALLKRLAWLWLAFCLVKIGTAVLLEHNEQGVPFWQPLLWEGSSLLVVTLLVLVQIRLLAIPRYLHTQPWRWLRRQLSFLPVFCLLFVPATYGLRHAVYALFGEVYQHAGWLQIYVYESLTLSLFYLLWLGVVFGLATREHLLAERIHAQETALALREAQLVLLRQQLQPHFLFNALNLISAQMYENVPRADALLHKLASFLRQTAAQATKSTHALADELAILRDYVDVMAARFEERVEIEWQIADELPDCELPLMICQPLLENAFKHGVEPLAGTTHLTLRVFPASVGRLIMEVEQDRGHCHEGQNDKGQGLANVRRRLAAHYGDAARLQLRNRLPEGVCATLSIPCAS